MSKKVSDFVVERLKAWGVTRIFGYPGDGINGVLGALQRAGSEESEDGRPGPGIEFIQVRHEEMAAFMAVAHAKFTGEPGVCLSTGGPGATHKPLFGIDSTNRDKVVIFGGGVPLKAGGVVIGGVGASGGTVDQDVKVVEAAAVALA